MLHEVSDMYKALYDYKSTLKDYLNFSSGEQFTILDKSRSDWYLAQNGFGEVGYVPHNYITKINATLQDVVKFIDRSIEAINYESTRTGGKLPAKLREDLNKLLQHRANIIEEFSQKPTTSTPQSPTKDSASSKRSSLKRGAPPPPPSSSEASSHSPTKSTDLVDSKAVSQKQEKSVSGSTKNHEKTARKKTSLSGSNEQKESAPPPPTRTSSMKEKQCLESSVIVSDLPNGENQNEKTIAKPQSTVSESTNLLNVKQIQGDEATGSSMTVSMRSLPNSPSRNFSSPALINVKTITVPSNFNSEVVEEVRKHTGLSYDKSCVAVEVVLSHVANTIPQISGIMDKILASLYQTNDDIDTETSHDATQIQHLLGQLSACKDDSQQRSWALHEDQHVILGYLEELLSILENAKPSICRKAIAKDGYDGIHNLVEYYQMETRTIIRLSTLKVFGLLCGLDAAVISHLLYSVLPLELINEIKTNYSEVQRLSYVCLVLTMLLCTAEPVPVNLQEQLSEEFIDFIFELIENPPSLELQDQAEDLLVNLILAINLQYDDHSFNTILDVVQRKGTVKNFTEKLMLIFNRGDDPVQMFEHQTSQPHSVLKLFIDIYSRQETSFLLYTNDAKVLLDIVLRQLTDLPTGGQRAFLNDLPHR
ncbi:hypothetical protein KUTeg_020341 [Tegillarca granosa]|uniref:SH3 domain-containing protein n=1 Tax=Tegillarca granosa TaxID=220873 RepID=A0ABQ9E7K8_TEGGR|nr:hypothetical protein KUTeg_020341 [Tegillarca granosa]